MSNIKIRSAEAHDVPAILSLIKELAIYEKLLDQVSVDEVSLSEALFPTNLKKRVAYALVAELDGELSGYAIYFYSFSTFLGKAGIYLEDLYVKESLRGNGIGTKLLSELMKIAKDEGLGRLEWSCLNWNRPSMDFYENLGAEALNEWLVSGRKNSKLD